MARGCCTARASNDTTPRQAAVWRSGQRLRFISTRSLVHPFAAARHFPSRGNKRLCRFPLRPLEGERATKWRGGAVRQEPQMTTPPRQAAVWRSGQPLRFISTRGLVHPFAAARHFPTGKHVTGFAARFAPLWIQFLCHPQGETRDCAAEPCAPLRGRGPQSGAGVLYGKRFK